MAKQDYSYSLDKESNLIHVKEAVKGNEYRCPCCGEAMIPRQGKLRKWHFAHKANLENCSYETYLHKIAKRRIRDFFNASPHFYIKFRGEATCVVQDCPLGREKTKCTWDKYDEFDLKNYYDKCDEEVTIDNFRADLLVTNSERNIPPILIEIFVSHKSTEEKINSKHRIIEVQILSEDDIERIVSNITIEESEPIDNQWRKNVKRNIISFYNFKRQTSEELPDEEHQQYKFRFWMNHNERFDYDRIEDYSCAGKCLSPNPPEIAAAKFLVESSDFIGWDIGFYFLSKSGLNIKLCPMCEYNKWNNFVGRSLCALYKTKGTEQYPRWSNAKSCKYFRPKNFQNAESVFPFDSDQEYKITIK